MPGLDRLPTPSPDDAFVVIDAPGDGPGFWAGGPSAAQDEEGTFWLAYRLRRPHGDGRGYANIVARSTNGVNFEAVDGRVSLPAPDFGTRCW